MGLVLEDKVPDAKTVWLYREQLAQAGMIMMVFENFDSSLKDRGYLATGGQIIDASIVSVPTQHNKPLSEREKQGNKTRSRVRARVEHIFGAQRHERNPCSFHWSDTSQSQDQPEEPRLQHASPGPTEEVRYVSFPMNDAG